MIRIQTLLVLSALTVVACLAVGGYASMKTPSTESVIKYNSLNPEDQAELAEYRKEELARRQRQEELNKLQNPKVLMEKLAKIGKILIYNGTIDHKDFVNESTFWGSRNVNLKLMYNFGISYDLRGVHMVTTTNELEIQLDYKQIHLEFLELSNDSDINSNATWLAANFTPEEIESIIQNAYTKTQKKIEANQDVYYQAKISLQENLTDLLTKLGCTKKLKFTDKEAEHATH